jgi:hypothetical protein
MLRFSYSYVFGFLSSKEALVKISCLPVALTNHLMESSFLFRHLASEQMAGGRVAHATLKGPSVVKEIFIGLTLGLVAGGMWKMHHWNEQRKTRSFYDMLDKGQISVVVEE